MKYLILLLITLSNFLFSMAQSALPNLYSFQIPALEGGIIDFSNYRGKYLLIVNTASACGYTPQYEALEQVYKQYQDKLVIVAVPSNDFGAQEPGSATEIAQFCKKNYGVSFPMAAKAKVVAPQQIPLYQWLCHKQQNGVKDCTVKWNFHKFLIDPSGHLLTDFPSAVSPNDSSIIQYLEP